MDEWTYFNPKKNRAFDHCTTILYIAEKNGETVGRIMGIISHQYNEAHDVNDVRFCYLETYDEQDVFKALIDAVADWARKLGLKRMVGPLGFSDKDPQGWLIEGYNETHCDCIKLQLSLYEQICRRTELFEGGGSGGLPNSNTR
jgi:hypothetical protein